MTPISNNTPVIHQRQIVMCSVYIHQIKEAYGESDKFKISSFIVHAFDGIQMQLDEWCAHTQTHPQQCAADVQSKGALRVNSNPT